jgi:hypothetical protein
MRKTDRIADEDLREFAESEDHGETRSVIVELEGEPADIVPKLFGRMPPVPRQSDVRAASKVIAGAAGKAMGDAERGLRKLGLGDSLVPLRAAHAFVVSVLPSQLRALARLPHVAIIRPNRTHKIPR